MRTRFSAALQQELKKGMEADKYGQVSQAGAGRGGGREGQRLLVAVNGPRELGDEVLGATAATLDFEPVPAAGGAWVQPQ